MGQKKLIKILPVSNQENRKKSSTSQMQKPFPQSEKLRFYFQILLFTWWLHQMFSHGAADNKQTVEFWKLL